jgi:hypothetical protein
MANNDVSETIAIYEDSGRTYEVDHLGINFPSQWGMFAVYWDGDQVAEFAIEESFLKPEYRPAALPVQAPEVIRLAKLAVAAAAR